MADTRADQLHDPGRVRDAITAPSPVDKWARLQWIEEASARCLIRFFATSKVFK